MDAYYYCAEYAHETKNGAIKFSKPVVNKFIITYTYLTPSDFTPEMFKRLRLIMVDYYNLGVSGIQGENLAPKKIELPKFIFE